jgi:hypothetical protein
MTIPRGLKGEKRPADANACAVMSVKILTGEMTDPLHGDDGKDRPPIRRLPQMNWRSGLIKAWTIGSLCWIVYWIWRSDLPCLLGAYSAPWCGGDNPFMVIPLTPHAYVNWALLIVGVPILALLLGFGIGWVLNGFRRRKVSH